MTKEISLENKLRQLFALQQIDNHLDELEELKGDLPHQVRELEALQGELQARLNAAENTMRTAFSGRDSADSEIISLKEKLAKYKTQQLEVKTNKQYDALTREMDHATETISKLEKEMTELETKATVARNEIEVVKAEMETRSKDLEELRVELAEVSKSTESEELKYTHEREKAIARVAKSDLVVYERIRKAKKGKAVVPVKRGACGGCFNKVPPQKLLELRQNNLLYTCEHCGRIIVSDEIALAGTSVH